MAMTESERKVRIIGPCEVARCRDCGSEGVQVLDWISPNTGEVIGGAFENGDPESPLFYYCPDCEECTGLIVESTLEHDGEADLASP